MSSKIISALTAGGVIGGMSVTGAAAYLAKSTVYPHTYTLEEEKKWEMDRGLWGDYDDLPHTAYTVAGKDGYILHCEYTEANPGSRRFVILTHGYTSNRNGSVKYVGVYKSLGYNIVIYDCRGHGENVPTPCSIGNLESQDLLRLIEDTYERYGEEIELGLHGESMGSATSLMVLKYHPKVRWVVADCGFASLYDLMGDLYHSKHIGFILNPVNAMMGILYHFNLKQTCPRDALSGNKVPLCLIHGTADSFIPVKNADELADATSGYCEVHKIEGADHAQSRHTIGSGAYAEIVDTFLRKISC